MLSPMKAIRAKCLDCMCGSVYEVSKCPSDDCSLFPYRFGHNPARKGIGRHDAKLPGNTELNEAEIEESTGEYKYPTEA